MLEAPFTGFAVPEIVGISLDIQIIRGRVDYIKLKGAYMRRDFGILLIVISVLLQFAMQCHAGHAYGGGGHVQNEHAHGNDWDDWAAALSLGLLGMGLWHEMTSPQYNPPKIYMQPMPEESIRPGYMYYCEYSNGYYPYVKGCPGGWLKVVPIPQPPPQ